MLEINFNFTLNNNKGLVLTKKTDQSTVFTRVSARGSHLILGSQRKGWGGGDEGAYSREALFRGRHSLNISKRDQSIFNLSL